jgi:hypothetical protein
VIKCTNLDHQRRAVGLGWVQQNGRLALSDVRASGNAREIACCSKGVLYVGCSEVPRDSMRNTSHHAVHPSQRTLLANAGTGRALLLSDAPVPSVAK